MPRIRKLKKPAFFLLLLGLLFICSDSFACAAIPTNSAQACPIQNANGNYQIFTAIFCLVQYQLTSTLATMYSGIVTAAAPYIQTVLIIYMALFGYAFMIGIAGAEPKEFIIRIFKLVVVMVLTTNQCAFFTYVYQFFISAQGLATLALPAGTVVAPGGIFANLDSTLAAQKEALTGAAVVMLAFLLTGPGFIVSAMISAGFLFKFKVMINTFKTLAISLVAITISLMFAPIFLCFLLFGETRDMFNSWLQNIISYTLQPVIIFFYFMILGQLDNTNYIWGHLVGDPGNPNAIPPIPAILAPNPPVIIADVPYCIPYYFGTFCFKYYGLASTASFNSTVTFTPPLTDCPLTSQIQIPGNPPTFTCPSYTMSIFYAALLYAFQWLILCIATNQFMKLVPDLATRLSHLGNPSFTPRLGSTQSGTGPGGIGGVTQGVIMPGFTSGYGGDLIKETLSDATKNMNLPGVIKGVTWPVRRVFRTFFGSGSDEE